MTFGLKNTGVTYQRLMDNIFKDQIDRNVEVYVDDMVIKSRNDDTLLSDVEEMFISLKKKTKWSWIRLSELLEQKKASS